MDPVKPVEAPTLEGRRQTLVAMWKEVREHGRQHETQRAVATNLILLLASADIAAISSLGIGLRSTPLALALVVLGALGYLITAKYYERFQRNTAIAFEIEQRLAELDPELGWREAKDRAIAFHKARRPKMHRIRLNKIWSYLHLIVLAAGTAIFVLCLALG